VLTPSPTWKATIFSKLAASKAEVPTFSYSFMAEPHWYDQVLALEKLRDEGLLSFKRVEETVVVEATGQWASLAKGWDTREGLPW